MAPSRNDEPATHWPTVFEDYRGLPRNIRTIDALDFDPSLQPKNYEIAGTHPESRILFLNVNILDSTGKDPYLGDALIEGVSLFSSTFLVEFPFQLYTFIMLAAISLAVFDNSQDSVSLMSVTFPTRPNWRRIPKCECFTAADVP